jgi:hypothetical protein
MPVVQRLSSADELLPGASFTDRFAVVVSGQSLDAVTAAERAFRDRPAWINRLMVLRNLMVRPFGLKTRAADLPPQQKRMGMLPVYSQSASRVVLGLDDRHLDFRLVGWVKAGSRSAHRRWWRRTIGSGGLISQSSCRSTG